MVNCHTCVGRDQITRIRVAQGKKKAVFLVEYGFRPWAELV